MRRFGTFAVLALAFSLSACGGGSGGANDGGGGPRTLRKVDKKEVLVFLRGDKSEILDPHATNSGADAFVIQQMYEGLVQPSEKAPVRWEPCLAESWDISPDFKSYKFKLRKGVKFHDGADLNAAGVKRSFERATKIDDKGAPTDKAAPGKLPYADEYFGGVLEIGTPDEMTVEFKLNDTNPKFLASCGLFAASVISPKAIEMMEKEADASKRQSWLTRHPAGTGPYTISAEGDYQDSANITMTAFAGYWGGKPEIPRVVFNWNQDQKVRREQLVSGAVQMIDSPAGADWADLGSNKDVVLYSWEAENLCYLGMNVDPANGFITSDINVRKAIAMAVDRDPLVKLYDGTAKAHHVLLPPTMLGFPKDYKPTTDEGSRADRLAKARELIKAAGADGKELILALPRVPRPYLGKPPQIADLLRQQIGEIGLTLKLEPLDMNVLGDAISKGAYPLVLIGWMGETGEPDDFWTPLLCGRGKPSSNNVPRFWDKEVADALDGALKERDQGKRAETYRKLETTVHEKHRPMVPLLTARQAMAWRAEVEGIFVDSTGSYRLHKARFK
ncbi:MAG: hypothetical protein IT462_16410 [Planctomycetes bacterium]|nr:hypothetical protein [Planctomycetota bacterium]